MYTCIYLHLYIYLYTIYIYILSGISTWVKVSTVSSFHSCSRLSTGGRARPPVAFIDSGTAAGGSGALHRTTMRGLQRVHYRCSDLLIAPFSPTRSSGPSSFYYARAMAIQFKGLRINTSCSSRAWGQFIFSQTICGGRTRKFWHQVSMQFGKLCHQV